MTRGSGGDRKGRGAKTRDVAGRPPSQRQLRVGEEVRHALARILNRGDLADPALAVPVTVTEVRMSPDLRNATAFVTPFGGGETAAVVKALNRAGGYFRGRIAQEVKLRLTPTIRFTADESFDEAQRVEALLHDPVVVRDLEAHDADESAADEDGAAAATDETPDGA